MSKSPLALRLRVRASWYACISHDLKCANTCVSSGCKWPVVCGGITMSQTPAALHARSTDACRWIFAQSMNSTTCTSPRLSRCLAIAAATARTTRRVRAVLFQAEVCRRSVTFGGHAPARAARERAFRVRSFATRNCGSAAWTPDRSHTMPMCVMWREDSPFALPWVQAHGRLI